MDRRDAGHIMKHAKTALSIAGSDSGGGAGIQADLKTFAALGVHGATAITAITAQNTLGVRSVHALEPKVVVEQIEAVLDDFDVAAIKIGMLATPSLVAAVAHALRRREPRPFVVYDPVMTASSGDSLFQAGFVESLAALMPFVDCLTPNLAEAAALLGQTCAASEDEMLRQGHALRQRGARAVLMKGGHLEGLEAVDWLITDEDSFRFAARRAPSHNLHGTGCTLSSALAAYIALGASLHHAARCAKEFISFAITNGATFRLGSGAGPVLQVMLR